MRSAVLPVVKLHQRSRDDVERIELTSPPLGEPLTIKIYDELVHERKRMRVNTIFFLSHLELLFFLDTQYEMCVAVSYK